MENSGLICAKFVKILSRKDISKNKLHLPSDFSSLYGERLPSSLHLNMRNGYKLPVDFNEERRLLKGLSCLYEDYGLKGGEMIVFEYYGGIDFNVYIIGTNFSEIEYPHIVHHLQTCNPRLVTLSNGGWRFVLFVDPTAPVVDEIAPPLALIHRCGSTFGFNMRFALSNGKKFRGLYNRETRQISDLSQMFTMFGVSDLKAFHMFIFTFDGMCLTTISAFDEKLVEIVFPGTPISIGESSPAPIIASRFEITIQRFHMFPYCYGVDIPAQYKDICDMWGKTGYINVYSGDCAWRLQIQKRADWKRPAIHDGWIEFRDGLDLNLGDICVFECPPDSYEHFSVRVIRSAGN